MAASTFTSSYGSFKIFLLVTIFICSLQQLFVMVQSLEFEVGDDKGWVVPSSKNAEKYNHWASKNRFQIGDSIRFKYKKDSVLVVTDSEYEKCRSVHPIFFSNNGDTVYTFERSGLFYFVSGVAGHCQKGQKMIIKVLENETPPGPPSNNTNAPPAHKKNGAVNPMASSYYLIVAQFVVSIFGFLFVH